MAGPIDPRLLRRAAATRGFLVAGVAVGSATAILTLGQAWLLSRSVAGIFDTGSLDGLWIAALLLLAVFAGKALLSWLHQWIAHRTSAAVKSQLRRDIISARLAHPVDSPTTTGGLITLVTQGVDALDGSYSKYLPQLVLAVTVPIIIGVAILASDFWSAVIVAVTMPLIPVFMALVGWTTEKLTKRRWAVQTRLAHHFADLVTGLPTLQVFGRAKAQARGLRETEDAHVRETMATLRVSFLSAGVLELLSTLSVAVIAVTIGFRVVFGELDLATALFVLILAPEAYLPIRQVGVHYHDSADGVAAAMSAFKLIDAHEPPPVAKVGEAAKLVFSSAAADATPASASPSIPDPFAAGFVPSHAALLSVRELTHTYPGTNTPALQPISFDVAPGEVLALAGGSGGGKTTLINALLGFLSPSGGELLVEGSPITDWTAWRRQVAFVGQFPGLVNGDIADNVRLGSPEASDAELREALDAAGAPELALDHSVGDNAEGVSSGERRRIATARALLRISRDHGRLLILDEPTAGLDPDAEATLLGSLRTSGVAVIVVSHRPAVLSAADRVITVEAPEPAEVALSTSPEAATTDSGSENELPLAEPVEAPVTALAEPVGAQATTAVAELEDAPLAELVEAPDGDPSTSSGNATTSSGSATTSAGDAPTDSGDDETPAEPDEAPASVGLIRSLLDAVPKSRKWLALSIFLAFSATAAQVALMGTSAWLLTFAALIVPPLFLQTPAVLVRFFAISRAALRYAERLASHNLALRMQSALRLVTYQRLSGTTLLGRRRGDLLTRVVADVEAIKDLMVRVWIPFISATGVILVTGLGLGLISPATGLVVLASAAIAGLLLPWLAQRGSAKADAEAVPLRGELGNAVHEIATAAPDLVAYGADKVYADKLLEIDGRLSDDEARSTWVRGITTAGQLLAAGLAVIGALLIGGAQAHDGVLMPQLMDWITNVAFLKATPPPMYAMQATVLAVLVLTPLALHEALSNLVQAAQVNTRAQAALTRVEEILDAEPVGSGDLPSLPEPVAEPGLSLHDLSVGWPGQEPVQTGLNLELSRGEIVGLVGPSGIGKTTVAATVLGLIPPLDGEAEIHGRVGYLPQDAHIFTTSIAENVMIGNKFATPEQVQTALQRSGLTLDPQRLVGETGTHLSGGEARRVALARLLVGDFQVLILDEPTEHLDLLTATALMDDIWNNTTDAAVLVITHDPAVISRCNRVITLT